MLFRGGAETVAACPLGSNYNERMLTLRSHSLCMAGVVLLDISNDTVYRIGAAYPLEWGDQAAANARVRIILVASFGLGRKAARARQALLMWLCMTIWIVGHSLYYTGAIDECLAHDGKRRSSKIRRLAVRTCLPDVGVFARRTSAHDAFCPA